MALRGRLNQEWGQRVALLEAGLDELASKELRRLRARIDELLGRADEPFVDLSRCGCPACKDEPPAFLEYHDLMRHSVYCREREIAEWSTISAALAAERLEMEQRNFRDALGKSALPDIVKEDAAEAARHLPRWIKVLKNASA